MSILSVNGLCKSYPAFKLDNISFALEKGRITGFIGRNGAGKTTTLKALLNLVHPDRGSIAFFGMPLEKNETEIRRAVGFVSGGVSYYPKNKLKAITSAVKAFYPAWDDKTYKNYLSLFALDERKSPSELSEGMKVKYSLALALSHKASLLLLDEPTSGLDPISRDELLDIFMDLARQGKTILFSTHITDDLDKCADDIIYIRSGRLAACEDLSAFKERFKSVLLSRQRAGELSALLVGAKPAKQGVSALINSSYAHLVPEAFPAALDEIMVHLEKES